MSQTKHDARNAFVNRMTQILNDGALNLALAIGYRTRLFDTMDRFDGARSATEIAAAAGVDSRYVQEWLGIMVTGGIVSCSADSDGREKFFLPKAHADVLTRRSGNSNLGVYTQEIPLLTDCAMEAVITAFGTGEGIDLSRYPRFQAFMGQLADAKHREVLVEVFLPSVDGGELVHDLQSGIRVCDLGCAQGVALLLMAEAFPHSTFVGLDISEEAVRVARAEALKADFTNVEFYVRDAATLAEDASLALTFDYVTAFDAIHDQRRPLEALKGVRAILKPNGRFSMVDIAAESSIARNKSHPMGPFLYSVSLMHCMPVGLADGGRGLGMMWGRQAAQRMLHQAGFADVSVCEIPEDPFNLHYFCRT